VAILFRWTSRCAQACRKRKNPTLHALGRATRQRERAKNLEASRLANPTDRAFAFDQLLPVVRGDEVKEKSIPPNVLAQTKLHYRHRSRSLGCLGGALVGKVVVA